jgi:hypothetical protein
MEEGWQFWVDHNGRIRQFMVGHPDEETARRAVQTYDPTITDLNFVSKAHLPGDLIARLGLAGKGVEWNPVDPASTFQIGGMDAG